LDRIDNKPSVTYFACQSGSLRVGESTLFLAS
jgi:hypothetical protein